MATKKIQGLFKLLEAIKSLKGKTFLMISELIDNSISSWLDDGLNKNVNGLIIQIDADFTSFNSAEHKIIVTDNAYGMDEKELEEALMIAFIKPKPSGLGVFGMGLKQAAFWLGRRLEISTKKEKGQSIHAILDLDIITKLKSDEDATYDFINMPKNLYKRGTEIAISNINVGVERSSTFYTEVLSRILGWKYNRYLSKGMKISIKYIKDGTYVEVEKFMPERENITEWCNRTSRDIESTKKELISQLTTELKDTPIRHEIINKINEDKHLVFDIPLDFNGIKWKMNYGILSIAHSHGKGSYKELSFTKVNGISVYQADRAVICGPNTEDNSTFHRERNDGGSGDIYKIRLFGILVVDPFVQAKIIDLDTNKSSFKWDDTDFKKYIEARLKEYKDKGLAKAVEVIGSYQNKQQEGYKGPNPKGLKKIQEAMALKWKQFANSTFEIPEKEIYSRDGSTVRPLLIRNIIIGEDIKNIMLIEEMRGDKTFITSDLTGDTLHITVNIEHRLWSPNIESNTDEVKRTIVYPLSIMLGIAQYAMHGDNNFQEKLDFEALMLYAEQLLDEA